SEREAAMVDLNLKVSAIEMLLKYTASGIGAVAGSMLGPWRARQAATVRRIEAEAEGDSLKLIADAQAEARRSLVEQDEAGRGMLDIGPEGIQQRIEFQEKKRQANIASVVRDAAAGLGDKEVPEHEPDPDWTARFFDCVQDVSSEDMQKLWSKVLSGEVESAGRTSLRTLDTLKNITSRDARKFQNVCGYVIHDFIFQSDGVNTNCSALSYNNLLALQDAGLVNASPMLIKELSFDGPSDNVLILYQQLILKISTKGGKVKVDVPNFLLTAAGKELHQFAKCEPDMDYLKLFSRFLRSKSCELSFARIVEKRPDGSILHTNPFVLIEPEDPTSRDTTP
ncbi:MAG: DUF2806 domain-containing protein, partial [Alphaproteobacteria bacterium]|nr:DUF2806 domain-containing protein [Alphaproteobacteria bacterium]